MGDPSPEIPMDPARSGFALCRGPAEHGRSAVRRPGEEP